MCLKALVAVDQCRYKFILATLNVRSRAVSNLSFETEYLERMCERRAAKLLARGLEEKRDDH